MHFPDTVFQKILSYKDDLVESDQRWYWTNIQVRSILDPRMKAKWTHCHDVIKNSPLPEFCTTCGARSRAGIYETYATIPPLHIRNCWCAPLTTNIYHILLNIKRAKEKNRKKRNLLRKVVRKWKDLLEN